MATPEIQAEDWDEVAHGFDDLVTPINQASGEQALGYVKLDAGTRFLDVAAGTGALSLPAARSGAEVLATDYAPAMVEHLRARARNAGLSNLDARVMDGTDLDLADDSFDVAASQHGVSLFPDMARGLSEMVRVVRPGGQVLISAFGPLEKAGLVHTFIRAVKTAAPEAPVPSTENPSPPLQVADRDELARRLGKAGLVDVRVQPIVADARFDSAEHYWEVLANSNPIPASLVATLGEDQRARALGMIEAALGERPAPGGGGFLTTELNVGIGTVPRRDA